MKFGRQLKRVLGKIKNYLAIGPFQIHSMSGVPAILQNGCQNIFSIAVSAIAMVLCALCYVFHLLFSL